MKVCVLIHTMGCSVGSKEFIGMYSTKEKAEEAKMNEMKKPFKHWEQDYSIKEIEVDKTYNEIYVEWG